MANLPSLVMMNRVGRVREILTRDPGVINDFVPPLLVVAIDENEDDVKSMIDTLLFFGADPNVIYRGTTPLIMAITEIRHYNPVGIIQSLIIAGADVNLMAIGESPLMSTISFNSDYIVDIVQALIISGADVDIQNRRGYTAMMILLSNYSRFRQAEFLTLFDILCIAGADLDTVENDQGMTAIDYIQRLPIKEMVLSRIRH